MKKFIAILCLCWADASFAHSPDSISFRLHLKKGDTYDLSCRTKDEGTSVRKGIPTTMYTTGTTNFLVSVDEVRANGATLITLKIVSADMILKSKDLEMRMDTRDSSKCYGSTKTAKDVAIDVYNEARSVIGTTFWVELNELGEMLRLNLDTVFKQGGDMHHIIKGRAGVALTMVSFADYPVKVGDTWKGIGHTNIEGKAMSSISDFTLKSVKGNVASISSSAKELGDVSDANLYSKMTGEEKVDILTGLSMESHYKMELEANSAKGPMKTKQDITIKMVKR